MPRKAADFQAWLKAVVEDPLVKAMLRRSLLTRPQLETLLIDQMAPGFLGRDLRTDEKASLRLGKKVTRGSFNRTLRQARENVLKAIYTVLLLGYLGLLTTPALEPYVELGSALKRYSEALRSGPPELLEGLRESIMRKVAELASPRALKTG